MTFALSRVDGVDGEDVLLDRGGELPHETTIDVRIVALCSRPTH
jgi:hypothetical protein